MDKVVGFQIHHPPLPSVARGVAAGLMVIVRVSVPVHGTTRRVVVEFRALEGWLVLSKVTDI